MLLGTYVSYEQNFDDYANLTEVIYGDDYLYYYKGHPNTPTGMYPQKQEQLDRLGITDVDSSVAAELILFFNPEVGLSGYGSSTYNSASADAAGGLWNSTKSEALKPGAAIDYSIMDWFASPITEDSDAAIRSLCKQDDSCYLVEFSDAILATTNYDFAIYSHDSGALTYFKKGESGYDVVKVSRGSLDVLATSHVSNDGWQSASILVYAFGKPEASLKHRAKQPNQDYLTAVYEFPGFFVTTEASWYASAYPFGASYRFQFEDALVTYEKGECKIYENNGNIYSPTEQATGDTGSINLPKSDAYAEEIKYFKNCVLSGQFPDKVKAEELRTVVGLLNEF